MTVSDVSVRRSGRCVLLALGLFAFLVLPAGAHEVYPRGWNVTGATVLEAHPFQPDSNHRHRATTAAPQDTAAAPTQVSSMRYQFVPGSNHRHRATTAAPQETAAAPAQVSSMRYQFVPGSNHRHSVQ